MSLSNQLKTIFPEESQIPNEFQISEIIQREYLVNGEIKIWNGVLQEVYSPVKIATDKGLVSKKLGSTKIPAKSLIER